MRVLSLLVVLSLLSLPVSAAPTKGAGGGKSGTTTVGGNAQDGTATGTADSGSFTFNDTNRTSYTATVDCARVEGNVTYFSGIVRVASRLAQAMGITPGFTYVYGEYVDDGEPATADSFELLTINPDGSEDPATYCESDRSGTVYPLTSGNIQVRF